MSNLYDVASDTSTPDHVLSMHACSMYYLLYMVEIKKHL